LGWLRKRHGKESGKRLALAGSERTAGDEKRELSERSSNFHMLPPGPNNPVGVVWIALNKKGIGILGTNDPDSIGRSASHGCIRLANWDIVKLAEMVKRGTNVEVE